MRLMSKIIVALFVVALLLPAAMVSAEDIDFTQRTDQELTEIIKSAQHELSIRRCTEEKRVEYAGCFFEEVAEHLTEDGEGYPCLIVEGLFTNNNSTPTNPDYGTLSISAYQKGVECRRSGMYLPSGFDWNTSSKNVKDGGTITFYKAIPLENLEDEVEINISIMDMNTWKYSEPITFIYSFAS